MRLPRSITIDSVERLAEIDGSKTDTVATVPTHVEHDFAGGEPSARLAAFAAFRRPACVVGGNFGNFRAAATRTAPSTVSTSRESKSYFPRQGVNRHFPIAS